MSIDFTQPVFVISVAAELADMHPQTLRQYDRLGLVTPSRASGRARRYSQMDVQKLRQIQELSQDGVSLEGIKRIMQLENQVQALQSRVTELSEELEQEREAAEPGHPVFGVEGPAGGQELAHAIGVGAAGVPLLQFPQVGAGPRARVGEPNPMNGDR